MQSETSQGFLLPQALIKANHSSRGTSALYPRPRGHLSMFGDVFLVVPMGVGGSVATGICWVEAKDAAGHPSRHGTGPHNKGLLGPKCQ